MRLPNLVHAAGAVLLATFLSGCTPSDAVAPPEPAPTFVAPYATDEEALAAAEAAYAEYTTVMAEILVDGGKNPSRLGAVAVGKFLDASVVGLEDFESKGGRASGAVINSEFKLQRYSSTGSESEVITVYLCSNVSGLVLEDADGKSLVAEGRPDMSTLQATFDFDTQGEALLLSDVDVWSAGEC